MSCRDPDILTLREQVALAQRRASIAAEAAERCDREPDYGRAKAESDVVRAEAARLASRLSRAERAYKSQVRALATAMRDWDEAMVDAYIHRHTGGRTTSRAETRARERRAMLDELRSSGQLRGPTPAQKRAVRQQQAADAKEPLASKIRALLLDAGRDDGYANAIARPRWQVQRWEWLDYEHLEQLMQMLLVDQGRRAARRVCLALHHGEPWRARLTPGEVEHGIDHRAVRHAGACLWLTHTDTAEPEPIALTYHGRRIAEKAETTQDPAHA